MLHEFVKDGERPPLLDFFARRVGNKVTPILLRKTATLCHAFFLSPHSLKRSRSTPTGSAIQLGSLRSQ